MNLKAMRKHIDKIDNAIVSLLNKRARITLKIARLKNRTGKSVYSPEREREVLQKIIAANKGPLDKKALAAIYREVMSSALALQKPLRIAYLGPQASFTHMAALKKFGSQVTFVPCYSIADVFLEVERENADYGVVPIENSIEGAVTHTLDMFMDSTLRICAQIILEVSHHLLGKCAKEKIKRVYSNPQVFGQCRMWLQENLPRIEQCEVSSTTRGAQIAAKEPGSACIASLLAAKTYRLKVIASDIEDAPHNVTRFLVIGKNEVPVSGKDKTSIMFAVKDRVGALHDMLVPFKKYNINLTKIESRPSKRKPWEYYFFVDLEGHCDTRKVKDALRELESRCTFLKVLGSYPVGE